MTTPTPLTGIEAMTVMYQEEYELRVQKEKELAAALDLQAAYFARCEQLCDALSAAQERAEKAEAERDELKRHAEAMAETLDKWAHIDECKCPVVDAYRAAQEKP